MASCDFVGSAMRDLRTHVILLHKNKGIKCPHCDYFTYPKSSIDKHVKRVNEKSAVPEKMCETCGKAFWQESKRGITMMNECDSSMDPTQTDSSPSSDCHTFHVLIPNF